MTSAIDLKSFNTYYNNLKGFEQCMEKEYAFYQEHGIPSQNLDTAGRALGDYAHNLYGFFSDDSVQITASDGTVVTKSLIQSMASQAGSELDKMVSAWHTVNHPYGSGDIGTSIAISNAQGAAISNNLSLYSSIQNENFNRQNTAADSQPAQNNQTTQATQPTNSNNSAAETTPTNTTSQASNNNSPVTNSAGDTDLSQLSDSDKAAIETRLNALDGTTDSSFNDALVSSLNTTDAVSSDKSLFDQLKDAYHGSWLQSLFKAIGLANPLSFLASTAAEAGYDYVTQDDSAARQSLAETFGSDLKNNVRSALNVIPGLGDLIFGSDTSSSSVASQNTGVSNSTVAIDSSSLINSAVNLANINVNTNSAVADNVPDTKTVSNSNSNMFENRSSSSSYENYYTNELYELRSEVIMAGVDTSDVNMNSVSDMQEALDEHYNNIQGYGLFSSYYKQNYKLVLA